MKWFKFKKNKDSSNQVTKKKKWSFFNIFKRKKKNEEKPLDQTIIPNVETVDFEQEDFNQHQTDFVVNNDNNNLVSNVDYSKSRFDNLWTQTNDETSNQSDTFEKTNQDILKESTSISAARNAESSYLKKDDSFFVKGNDEVYYEQPDQNPVEKYGVPFNIDFDNKEVIKKNLSFHTIYTQSDLNNFDLPESDFTKFFKNGTVLYKLKDQRDDLDKLSVFSVFKNDTKFSSESVEQTNKRKLINSLKSGELFSYWEDDFNINEILQKNLDDSEKRSEIKEKIFDLNKSIEDKLKNINLEGSVDQQIGELIYTRQAIQQKQEELKDKIYELKESFSNSNIFFKIQNLYFRTWDKEDIYFNYKLENISFDIYPNDRIVVISDDSITNQLLIDVMKGDELKSGGYIYKNVIRKNQWIDVSDLDYNYTTINNVDLNDELLYGLTSPDYLAFSTRKKDNVGISMQRIFKALAITPEDKIKERLIDLMKFNSQMNKHISELDDLNLEKFFTICDILINKKMVLIKSICQGMSFNEKMELLNFLNKYFASNKVTAIYASDDLNDVNLFATKVMVIKQGQLIDFKSIETILKHFNSVNEYVIHNLKYGVVNDQNKDTYEWVK